MKIEEYLESLPENLIGGDDASLSDRSLREIFSLAGLGRDDTFYHLGCGDEKGVMIALQEFNVKKAVGIDINPDKIGRARSGTCHPSGTFLCQDVLDSEISDATAILFWFTDDHVIDGMMEKFRALDAGTRIVTIWGPLPDCLPQNVKFPYIINRVPFKKSADLSEQLLSVFGVKCIDFVTAWEFAERYTKSIAHSGVANDRFLTIIQTLMIWINARNMGVSCGSDVPESIRTYISIMREHFGIDFGHLLKDGL